MAKRFTDTNKYRKPFMRGLQGAYKLLWDFLYHDCDHAGIWIVDFDIAQIYVGSDMPVNRLDALKNFNTADEQRIVELDNGKKWFIPAFIEFQYGVLNPKNNAHAGVIKVLNKYNLLDDKFKIKPLISPSQGGKDMDKEMDKDKDKEGGAGGKSADTQKFLVPEMLQVFKKSRPQYPDDIERDFKPLLSIASFIHKHGGLNGNHVENKGIIMKKWEQLCSTICDDSFYASKTLSVISNQIQDIYQIQKDGRTKSTKHVATGKHQAQGNGGY